MKSSSSPDVIGVACRDFVKHGKAADIKVQSNIPENSIIPVKYLFRSYKEMPELEHKALSFCKGKVLEIGGGVGSHSLELQNSKMDVVLLDNSKECCAIAQERGVKKVVCSDLENYFDKGFDTILMMMNGIGITGTLNGLKIFLDKARLMLNKGGQIIFDSCDILYMYLEEDGGLTIDLNGKYYGEVEYTMQYKQHKGNPFPWLFISKEVMMETAEQNGFSLEILFEEEDGMYLGKLRVI